MVRNLGLVIVFSLLIALLLPSVQAIGLAGGWQFVTYKKGLEKDYVFTANDAQYIDITLRGNYPNMSKYITLIDDNPGGGPRNVIVRLKLTEDVAPGKYGLQVDATERAPEGASISARASIRGTITILVLSPGKYLEWVTGAANFNLNQTGNITITATSLGTDTINEIKGKIDVYDDTDTYITTIYTETKSLASDTTETITAPLDSHGLKKGNYKYNATLYWDGKEEEPKSSIFRIGSLEVFIRDYSQEFIADAVNLLTITVESDWNGIISDVYATINTPNKALKTPTIELEGFKTGTLETYWDTTGLPMGDYNGTIIIHYAGAKTEKKVLFSINQTGKGVEIPKKETFISHLSTTTLILIIAIIFLIGNFIFFFIRGQKKTT